MIPEEVERIFGMDVDTLMNVRKKLCIMGIKIEDILIFLDRDKVQLFAEQRSEIKYLKRRIESIKKVVEDG